MSAMLKYSIIFGAISLVVIALVIYGFTVIGTPSARMAGKFDSTRMSNFAMISDDINYYYLDNGKLPNSLSDLSYVSTYNKDPQTGSSYTYIFSSGTANYQLCAIFSEDSSKEKSSATPFYPDTSSKTHAKGYSCINYSVPTSYQSNQYSSFGSPFETPNSSSLSESRDARRIADVRQLQSGLELYYNDCNRYPATLTTSANQGCTGLSLGTYLPVIPANTSGCTVTAGGGSATTYGYEMRTANDSGVDTGNTGVNYRIYFCTEGPVLPSITAGGAHYATPSGLY